MAEPEVQTSRAGLPVRKNLRALLQLLGLEVFVRRPGYHYVAQKPGDHCVPDYYGHSAHKHVDIRSLPQFGELAAAVIGQGNTLLYYDRLYTIYQSLANLRHLVDPQAGANLAEVGVYKGGTSYFIAAAANSLGLSPATLHCFDTFEGHAPEDICQGVDRDALHHSGVFGDTQLAAVKQYLQEFSNVRFYQGRFQDTAPEVENQRFHFVHLDVDIYAPTLFALRFFAPRMITGGTVVVDDYGFTTCPGAKQAVDKFLHEKRGYFSLHLLSGQCVLVRCETQGAA